MWTHSVKAVVVVLGLFAAGTPARLSGPQSSGASLTYEQFMELGPQQRVKRFEAMTPDEKAAIVQTHAQRWLEKNRDRLSAGQIALVQEAIDFVTPALYRDPNAPEQARKYQELSAKLKCQMRHSDVMEAFGAVRPPPEPSHANWLDELWDWFTTCVIGVDPAGVTGATAPGSEGAGTTGDQESCRSTTSRS